MLKVIRNREPTKELFYQGLHLALIRQASDITHKKSYDGVIVDIVTSSEAERIIKTIRLKEGIEGLIPLFVNNVLNISKEILSHTDGFVDIEHLEHIKQKTIAINKRLAEMTPPSVSDFETQVTYRMLAFLYTRNEVYMPFTSRASRIGYHFPLLNLYFKEESLHLLKTLETLEKSAYVAKTFKDHIHLCKSCDSTYLNFKEICPSCKSADIHAHDMIHHFVCAYIAPENDFITEDGLSCPKCDKRLRHIGIDYDKPSSIFSCKACANEFQNPEMSASCFDCAADNMLSELLHKTISNYSITVKGEQWLGNVHKRHLKQGVDIPLKSEMGLPFPIFKILIKQELKRVQTSDVCSQFLSIHYENDQLDALNPIQKGALKTEISEIIQSYLAPSDVITVQNYKQYYALLPDTPKETDRIELIRYNLSKLLTDNLKTEDLALEVISQELHQDIEIATLFAFKK